MGYNSSARKRWLIVQLSLVDLLPSLKVATTYSLFQCDPDRRLVEDLKPNILRDGGNPSGVAAVPTLPSQLGAFGGEFKADSGHTEWVDARTHQTGFTTTFTPNTKCPYVVGGKTYDIDFNSMREGRSTSVPTYAVVTSRSHHVGLVQVAIMDGSVRSISNAIELTTWQALGTRAGGEVIGE